MKQLINYKEFILRHKGKIIPLILVLLFAVGVMIKLFGYFEPYLYPLHMLQGQQKIISERIIIGPYPHEQTVSNLNKHLKIKTIISLLDSENLVYEKSLLETEKINCAKNNIKLINIPMNSSDLESIKTAKQLSEIIHYVQNNKSENIYIHCYLGKHRAVKVADTLKEYRLVPQEEVKNFLYK